MRQLQGLRRGTGTATSKGRRVPLCPGTLVLIEHVDVPPAYTKSGDELPRGRP